MSSTPLLQTRKDGGVGDGVRQPVEGAYLLPAQWEPRHDGVYGTPAGHLFAAVLESAVRELALYRSTTGTHRLHARARAWFVGDPLPCRRDRARTVDCRCDTCWPLSFVNCCAALGLDADRLRRRVLAGTPVLADQRRYRVSLARGLGQKRIG